MNSQTKQGLRPYLTSDEVIDWQHPLVAETAQKLKSHSHDQHSLIETSFNFVRDQISHSTDVGASQVTCAASQVLIEGTGYCYAKSHLLAALLRANSVAAGFSYQRLSLNNGRYCLHGLNSVYLPKLGWFKVDARGNNSSVQTHYNPPEVSLAFKATQAGEQDSSIVYSEPLEVVVSALQGADNIEQIDATLPDAVLR